MRNEDCAPGTPRKVRATGETIFASSVARIPFVANLAMNAGHRAKLATAMYSPTSFGGREKPIAIWHAP
jgi:hypothetical protein